MYVNSSSHLVTVPVWMNDRDHTRKVIAGNIVRIIPHTNFKIIFGVRGENGKRSDCESVYCRSILVDVSTYFFKKMYNKNI